jgi:hypothetical protein
MDPRMPTTFRRAAPIRAAWLLLALGAPAAAQETATSPGDADAGTSYLLRQSTLWYDRWLSGLFTHATANLDVDKDGDLDVFIAPGNGQDQRLPVRILVNDGNGNFTDGTAGRISNAQPGLIHARKALVGDYNHDGWPDVFVAGHGYDQPPFPGEYPQLFLSNGDGTLRYDGQLSGLPGFNHAAASGDVDRNGSVDIVVMQQGAPYVLLNDGHGVFTKNTALLPAELLYKNYYSLELIDVDRDGWLDVLFGGHEFEGAATTVYWGGAGGWSAGRKFVFPAVAGKGIVLDFAAEDIDGDGLRDLVADRSGESPFYNGRAFQILRATAPRSFVDETGARIAMDTSQPWIDYFRLQDINGDQAPDLLIDDKHATFTGAYAWTNDGHGVFAPYAGAVAPSPALSIEPASTTEGDAGTKLLTFTVRSSQPVIGTVLVRVSSQDGTAFAGSDYEGVSVPVQIYPRSSSAQVGIAVSGDTVTEPSESVAMALSEPTGATIHRAQAAGTIVNDDLATLSIADATITEGTGGAKTLRFVVSLDRPMHAPVWFDAATADGSALAGSDYLAKSQAGRMIDAGRTTQVFEVGVVGDAAAEASEALSVQLANIAGAKAGDIAATGTIVDDDGAAAVATVAKSGSARAMPVATSGGDACAALRREIGTLEARVATGRLGEAAGIRAIVALERRARLLGCAAD